MKSAMLFFACLLAGVGTCHAASLVNVHVIDRDTGSTLQTYWHEGRTYIAGTPGHRYAIRLHNRSGARILAVLSVDGVNAISGEDASPDQSGYVLGPYGSTTIDGWRKSLSQIAEFNFTALSNSYAARTGRPQNVGVIGVAVFREKSPRPLRREKLARQAPTAAPSTDAAPPEPATMRAQAKASNAPTGRAAGALDRDDGMPAEESLGTGHGRRAASYASYTSFERATSQPQEIDSIWYDSYRDLAARGIIRTVRPLAAAPQPFPNRFVPDPPTQR